MAHPIARGARDAGLYAGRHARLIRRRGSVEFHIEFSFWPQTPLRTPSVRGNLKLPLDISGLPGAATTMKQAIKFTFSTLFALALIGTAVWLFWSLMVSLGAYLRTLPDGVAAALVGGSATVIVA